MAGAYGHEFEQDWVPSDASVPDSVPRDRYPSFVGDDLPFPPCETVYYPPDHYDVPDVGRDREAGLAFYYKYLASPMEGPLFSDERPLDPSEIVKGQKLDLESLLCSHQRDFLIKARKGRDQVKVSSLKEKYVAIACFPVPLQVGSSTHISWNNFLSTYYNLVTDPVFEDEFVLVLVSKSKTDAFSRNQLVNACPDALVIPTWDKLSTEYVCKYIGTTVFLNMGFVLLDKSQCVLMTTEDVYKFRSYGPASFPFTDQRFRELGEYVINMRMSLGIAPYNTDSDGFTSKMPPLDRLLCVDPSVELRDVRQHMRTISISSLMMSKRVALYLCYHGTLIPYLRDVNVDAGQESINIVLVHLPFDHYPCEGFISHITDLFKRHEFSCWEFPFNPETSWWFWRMFSMSSKDILITMAPHGGNVELSAAEMIMVYGSAAYPSSAEEIVDKEVARLRELTIESLLTVSERHSYVIRDGEQVSLASLRDRYVILYLDHLDPFYSFRLGGATEYLSECHLLDIEVVFLPLDKWEMTNCHPFFTKLPWLLLSPFHPAHSASVIKQLCLFGSHSCSSSFVLFGKDGKIISFEPDLSTFSDLPGDNLRKEVLTIFRDSLEHSLV